VIHKYIATAVGGWHVPLRESAIPTTMHVLQVVELVNATTSLLRPFVSFDTHMQRREDYGSLESGSNGVAEIRNRRWIQVCWRSGDEFDCSSARKLAEACSYSSSKAYPQIQYCYCAHRLCSFWPPVVQPF
jgi:hypothetical protein